MPDIWTHIIFGEEVIAGLDNLEVDWIEGRENFYRFACQGPDFFFYYKFLPWQNNEGLEMVGHRIHNEIGGQFVHHGIRYLKNVKDGLQRMDRYDGKKYLQNSYYQSLTVYMIGLITHYAMDAIAHPYIFHKTGVYLPDNLHTHQYKGNHKVLEEIIDSILLWEKWGLKAHKEPVYTWIQFNKLPDSFYSFYQHLVNKLFKISLSKEALNQSYQDMIRAWKLFYDPYGIKVGLFKVLKKVTFGNVQFDYFFYPRKIDEAIDYLNRVNGEWCHPLDRDEIHDESFDQLWDKAKKLARMWIRSMFAYLEGEIDYKQLLNMIPTLSFSTGKNPAKGGGREMMFFNPVVEVK